VNYYVSRMSWAEAVQDDTLNWTFKGIAPYNSVTMYRRDQKRDRLLAAVLCDDRYVDEWVEGELQYLLDEGVYDDEWDIHCRQVSHRDGACPHAHIPEETIAYERAYQKLLHDVDSKSRWLHQHYIDVEDLEHSIDEIVRDVESLAYFLKEHPVEGCFRNGEVIPLEKIIGYCGECNVPLTEDDPLGCPSCSDERYADMDDVVFSRTHSRPFNWPPGAPFPPSYGFDGAAVYTAPWED
jgi:hypothetical protein